MAQQKNKIFKNIFPYAAYAILVALSTVFTTESAGILRTIPFVLVLPALATFFINKKLITVFLCFAIALCFGAVERYSVAQTVFNAVAAGAFAGIGILAKRFFVTACVAERLKKLMVLCGALLLIIGGAAYAFVFGNPVHAAIYAGKNAEYIKNIYGENAPEIRYTHYDALSGKYFTNVGFTDETYMNADISLDGTEVYDGYSNYYEYKILSERRTEMSQLLTQRFPGSQFALRINMDETDISVCAADVNDPQKFYGSMVFDLAFYGQLREKDAFADECRKYAEYLKSTGTIFAHFNYYGGFADEFLYEMAVPCGFEGDYTLLAKDFEGETFNRYYEESDYIDGWSYGR